MVLRRVARGVLITDLLILGLATFGAMVTKFGLDTTERTWGSIELTYPQFGVVLALLWSWMLSVFESRDPRVLATGLEEFRRVGRATAFTFGFVAVVAVVLKLDFSRGYVAVALPLGLVGLIVSRCLWRVYLERRLGHDAWSTPVLVVGSAPSAERIAALFDLNSSSGFRVVGTCSPPELSAKEEVLASVRTAFDEARATSLIVTDPHAFGHDGMRSLRWEFEGADILVAPHFADVAPGRVRLAYVAGETLVHLDEPQFARAGGLLKGTFDRVLAFGLVVLLAPLLIGVALAVKLSSPGPVLFQHVRVGRDGKPFVMWKFRSMRDGADSELSLLLQEQGQRDSPLFKPVDDPRITRVGRFIRRYSLDELPQLFNVIGGSMSLVGPRPQVPEEVALYRGVEGARLRVRPGITGLWQVSGRSNLSWQDAVRLDVYYVENWSMLVDLVILWRTFGAVVRSEGAR